MFSVSISDLDWIYLWVASWILMVCLMIIILIIWGRSPELFVAQEIVSKDACGNCLSADVFPAGTTVNTEASYYNVRERIYHPHYNNNIKNLRATPIEIKIQTKSANSKIYVEAQFTMRFESVWENKEKELRSLSEKEAKKMTKKTKTKTKMENNRKNIKKKTRWKRTTKKKEALKEMRWLWSCVFCLI